MALDAVKAAAMEHRQVLPDTLVWTDPGQMYDLDLRLKRLIHLDAVFPAANRRRNSADCQPPCWRWPAWSDRCCPDLHERALQQFDQEAKSKPL
jgi:hypothetical protein